MSVDPADDRSFWFTGMYNPSTAWSTRIGSFSFAGCTPIQNQSPSVTINSPADGATFTQGDTINFSGTATDPEDGDVTASLSWTSSIDGNIGSGGSFSTTTLSVGNHDITATATDSQNAMGSDMISITVNSQGGGNIVLTITNERLFRNGRLKADLSWTGATSANVDILRNGAVIDTVANTGSYAHNEFVSGTTFDFQVCEAGTSTCSNVVTLNF